MVHINSFINFILPFIIVWIISEVVIVKSIKNRPKDESIWLAINIILPIVGCIIYKLSHGNKKVKQ
jgi:hypothetical protein